MADKSVFQNGGSVRKKQKLNGQYSKLTVSLTKEQKSLLEVYSKLKGKSISSTLCELLNFKHLKHMIGDSNVNE